MNGHSTAVVKAQLSSRHTFPVKNNRAEIRSPPLPANRTSIARICHSHQRAFPKRSAFWKPSATLPASWMAQPSFSRFFSGTGFPEKAFARTDASFLFIFILYSYRGCPSGCGGFRQVSPRRNTSHLLYRVSLARKKNGTPYHTLYNMTTKSRNTFIRNPYMQLTRRRTIPF